MIRSKLVMFKLKFRFFVVFVKFNDFEESGVSCLVICYNRYENF